MADEKNTGARPGSQHLNEHTGFPTPTPVFPPAPAGKTYPGVRPDSSLRGLNRRSDNGPAGAAGKDLPRQDDSKRRG